MTTLRVVARLALGLMFLAFLACDNGSPTEPTTSVEFQTVVKTTILGFAPDPSEREVRDRATWQATWSELYRATNPPPLPEIDFNREMVLLVEGPGCCGKVEILAIDRGNRGLVVNALSQSSTNTICVAADFSVHIVRLARSETPVRFSVARESGLCQR